MRFILILSRFQNHKLMKPQIINYKKQSYVIFLHQEKKTKYLNISIPKISIYLFLLFISFVLFPHNLQILLF